MIDSLPVLKDEIYPGSLGFYEYRRCLKCPIGGLSKTKVLDSGSLPDDIPNKKLIIGNIFHDLMDYAKSGVSKKEILIRADELIKSADISYSEYLQNNKLGSLKSWSEITKAVRTSIESISKNDRSIKEAISIKNNKLRSLDGRFVGVPDKYYFIDDTGYIVEYKTAGLYVDNEINPEYVEQVKFYSVLIYQTYPGTTSIKCIIKSLNGSSWEIVVLPEEAHQYHEIMNVNYSNIAKSIEDKITTYDDQNCVYCKKSVFCDKYLQKCIYIESDKDIYVITGKVVNKNNEQEFIYLDMGGQEIKLSPKGDYYKSINIGEVYTFYNMKMRNKKLMWGQYSGIYRN